MSNLTLEDVAECIDAQMAGWSLDRAITKAGRRIRREAALVRAADEVVKEAKRHRCDGHVRASGTTMYCAMCERLARVDKISRGEAP